MKSNSKDRPKILCALLAFGGILLGVGCQTQAPTAFIPVPSEGNAPNMVINFEGSPATVVNAGLAEAGVPGNVVQVPGVVGLSAGTSVLMSVVSPGADGTDHALQVVGGPVPSTGGQCQLTIRLDTNSTSGYYNASLFSGVKFYLRVMPDDNTTAKFFSIPIAQTMLVGNENGTCPANCYDHFGYTYTGTNGQWQLISLDFSSLKRSGFGGPVNPPTLTGTNLVQFVQLQWQENSNGSSYADFGIDEVQFY